MMRFLPLLLVLLLAACSGPKLPFAKGEASGDNAIKPPWEALEKAGPGAENDLDLETLDGPLIRPLPTDTPTSAPESGQTAVAGPDQVKPEESQKAKKKGPVIKAVAVPNVIGAKGKGNSELTTGMRNVLKEAGWPVLAGRREDALLITGKVTLGSAGGPEQRVKLVWTVAAPDGKVLGEIVQENAVPAGSLDKGWGEEAQYATEAAAEGIFKLIQGFR
jgi:hypothetical protein